MKYHHHNRVYHIRQLRRSIILHAKCDHCDGDSEDTMHLLYGCHNVNRPKQIQ